MRQTAIRQTYEEAGRKKTPRRAARTIGQGAGWLLGGSFAQVERCYPSCTLFIVEERKHNQHKN